MIHKTKIIVGGFFFLLCLTVFFAIASAGKGAHLVALEKEIYTLESQNRELEVQIVNQNSLKKVAEKAQEQGLVKATNVLYWNQDLSVAKLP